jgi:endonuclease YncB( thermonuclease family)
MACAAVLALAHAALGLAAETKGAKSWRTLDNCRYVEDKGNDGDSFHLQCATRKFVLRLYFVDAPEQTLQYGERVQAQAKHFGTSLDETLAAGARASAFVKDQLRGPFVVMTKRANASGRSKEQRFYGLVQISGRFLHELLLVEGLARVHGTNTALPDGTKSRDYLKRLDALEGQARAERRGIWARSSK